MRYKFDFSFLAERWPAFLEGAWLTIQLTVVSIVLGFAVGTVCAVLRVYGTAGSRAGRRLCRGDPQHAAAGADLHRLFRHRQPGLKLSAELSAIIALVINVGAYTTEIMRAGIESIQRPSSRPPIASA